MRGISGKNVIVSAGSSGLGRGIAGVMAGYGANVTVFSRSERKLSDTVSEIKGKTGTEINAVKADLSNRAELEKVIHSAHERYGPINFLVMNYGDPKVAPFLEISEEEWNKSIDMMLRSTLMLTRSVLDDMLKQKAGRIVYVKSMTTKNPLENFSISASLRSAVVALGKVLSLELASEGINVNSISQGFFMTDRLRNIARQNSEKRGIGYDQALDAIKQTIPMKRFGEPGDLGELVAFLCAEESSYITGTNMQIDGGIVKFPF